jgi:hypothetical protein
VLLRTKPHVRPASQARRGRRAAAARTGRRLDRVFSTSTVRQRRWRCMRRRGPSCPTPRSTIA